MNRDEGRFLAKTLAEQMDECYEYREISEVIGGKLSLAMIEVENLYNEVFSLDFFASEILEGWRIIQTDYFYGDDETFGGKTKEQGREDVADAAERFRTRTFRDAKRIGG